MTPRSRWTVARCSFAVIGVAAFLGVAAEGLGAASTRTTEVTVYLVRGSTVAPVRRSVAASEPARAAVVALLRGPTAAERRAGQTTALPAGTRLRGISVSRGIATVDLSRRFESGGGSLSMLLRVAQVVHTLTQFPTIERVRFRLDGARVTSIGGEGVVVDPPVGRIAFENEVPPILIERPLDGDIVPRTIVVTGTANVFEARLFVDLVSGSRVLVHRAVSATSGTGLRGTFRATLRVPPSVRRPSVVAYTRSPKDGRRIGVTRIRVTVG